MDAEHTSSPPAGLAGQTRRVGEGASALQGAEGVPNGSTILALEGQDAPRGPLLCLDGFEGPLDLLLDLARAQKVDLSRISILPLVAPYLSFVD